MSKEAVLNKIKDVGIVAVIRAESVEQAAKITDACVAGGVTTVELCFTVPNADQLISQMVKKYEGTDVTIGAGTVLMSHITVRGRTVIGSGNRISWLIATVPCILFAVFGVNSFIVLTRIMSGVVVLVSIMLVLTYGKSRKKAGSSPICGVIGTVPFQVLMVISTVLSAIGALIPLS